MNINAWFFLGYPFQVPWFVEPFVIGTVGLSLRENNGTVLQGYSRCTTKLPLPTISTALSGNISTYINVPLRALFLLPSFLSQLLYSLSLTDNENTLVIYILLYIPDSSFGIYNYSSLLDYPNTYINLYTIYRKKSTTCHSERLLTPLRASRVSSPTSPGCHSAGQTSSCPWRHATSAATAGCRTCRYTSNT